MTKDELPEDTDKYAEPDVYESTLDLNIDPVERLRQGERRALREKAVVPSGDEPSLRALVQQHDRAVEGARRAERRVIAALALLVLALGSVLVFWIRSRG